MIHWLKELTALAEDLCSVPSTVTTAFNSSCMWQDIVFWPLQAHACMWYIMHTQVHTHACMACTHTINN